MRSEKTVFAVQGLHIAPCQDKRDAVEQARSRQCNNERGRFKQYRHASVEHGASRAQYDGKQRNKQGIYPLVDKNGHDACGKSDHVSHGNVKMSRYDEDRHSRRDKAEACGLGYDTADIGPAQKFRIDRRCYGSDDNDKNDQYDSLGKEQSSDFFVCRVHGV
jgi:hypothetical protein